MLKLNPLLPLNVQLYETNAFLNHHHHQSGQKGKKVMDTQVKELIAIGASVTANCVPCLRHHLKKAREAGVDDAKIHAAVSIGRMVRKGAASTWDEEAESLLGAVDSSGSTGIKDQAEKVCGES